MISEELLQSFIAEASDLLDDVEPSLVQYSRLQDVDERTEIVNRVFRHFHSIKGSAGFVGLHNIARLTHEAETLLEQFRKSPDKVIPQEIIALLCSTVDLLRAIFAASGDEEQDNEELGIDQLIGELADATKKLKGRQSTKGFSALNVSADAKGGDESDVNDLNATQIVNQQDLGRFTSSLSLLPEAAFGAAPEPPLAVEPPPSAPPPAPPAAEPVPAPPAGDQTPAPDKAAAKSPSGRGKAASLVGEGRSESLTRARRMSSDTARIIHTSRRVREDKMTTTEFAGRYVSEANELLEQIEQALLQAEQHPEASGDAIQEALRCLHSFKGNSGFMNLTDLERLSHRMESEVESTIGRALGLDSQTFDALLQMIDVLRQGVLDYSCGGSGAIPEADAYIAMMDEFSTTQRSSSTRRSKGNTGRLAGAASPALPPAPPPPPPAPPAPSSAPPPPPAVKAAPVPSPDTTRIGPIDRPKSTEVLSTSLALGARPAAGLGERNAEEQRKSTDNSTTVRARPQAPQPQAGGTVKRKSTDTTRLVLRGSVSQQVDLRTTPKMDKILITGAPPPPPTVELPGKIDLGLPEEESKGAKTTEAPRPKDTRKQSDTGQKRRSAEQVAVRNDIRVDLRKLDAMLDLVGELVIAEAMVTRHPVVRDAENESLERAVHQLRRVASSLQDMATSVRMIPLAPTFRRMTRLVYDLSGKAGKMVDLILLGEETEVDRTVIERISDPLVHIIRNAIDHGIEPPEDRIKLGKPEIGRLTIEGHHEGGEVWIVITDDGRGLNREAILQRAISRGLIQGDGSDLTDSQIYHFIFEPGFSTATKVTDISGRGFGMDVVKKNIEKLSGKIDIRTRAGEGTAVVLRIPLTLAIIEGMLISAGDTRYIIPLLSIRESLKPDLSQIMHTPDGQQLVKIRNELIPIVKLDETFTRVKSTRSMMDGILMIVEGEDGDVVALFADELLGQQETVIKGLSGWLKRSRGVSGCTILGDGEVGLILDIGAIVRLARQKSSA